MRILLILSILIFPSFLSRVIAQCSNTDRYEWTRILSKDSVYQFDCDLVVQTLYTEAKQVATIKDYEKKLIESNTKFNKYLAYNDTLHQLYEQALKERRAISDSSISLNNLNTVLYTECKVSLSQCNEAHRKQVLETVKMKRTNKLLSKVVAGQTGLVLILILILI